MLIASVFIKLPEDHRLGRNEREIGQMPFIVVICVLTIVSHEGFLYKRRRQLRRHGRQPLSRPAVAQL